MFYNSWLKLCLLGCIIHAMKTALGLLFYCSDFAYVKTRPVNTFPPPPPHPRVASV